MAEIFLFGARADLQQGNCVEYHIAKLKDALSRGDIDLGDGRRLVSDDAFQLAKFVADEYLKQRRQLDRKVPALIEQARNWKRKAMKNG